MQEIKECHKIRSQALSLKALPDNRIALGTQLHGIQIFTTNECNKKKIFALEHLNHKTTALDFHKDENICAVANNNIIYIISLLNKRILQTIYTYNGKILQLYFMPDTPYLISGTDQGRVMLYRYDSHCGISRLVSFHHQKQKSYVSSMTFNNNYIATSGYGGSVKLINLFSHQLIKVFHDSKVRINSICFINDDKLVFGNINGTLYLNSIHNEHMKKILHMPFHNVKHIIHFPQSNFILVSGEANQIVLVDIKKAKILHPKYLSFAYEVESMVLSDQEELLVVLKNHQIYHIKLSNIEDIKQCVLNKDLPKAFEIITNDPRLQNSKEHKRAETLYEKLYAKTLNALIRSNKQEFKKNVDILNKIESKSDEIGLLHKASTNYSKFQSLYLQKKYALAYNLSDKLPPLKYTPQYKKMEESFKERFAFAQKQILLGQEHIAKETLRPYLTVLSKRPIISLLLQQNKELLTFLKALQNKEYQTIQQLIAKHEIFKEIPSYTVLIKSQEDLLQKISLLIDNAKIDEAIQQIKELQDSTYKQKELNELYNDALTVKEFLVSYKNNDFKKCYELIDKNERLQQLDVAKLLEKHWQKIINKCEKYALLGDAKNIKKTLNELLRISTRLQKTGDLLRLSFHIKIQQYIKENDFSNAENMIYSYMDIFGTDKEIRMIANHYEKYTLKKLAITYEEEKKYARNSWSYSDLL